MKKNFIGTLVLASLTLGNVPLASSLQLHRGTETTAKRGVSNSHNHACCPDAHSRFALPLLLIAAPAAPCGDEHPCCAKRGPVNPPSLPIATSMDRTVSDSVLAASPGQTRYSEARMARTISGSNPFPPYFLRTTVLRIWVWVPQSLRKRPFKSTANLILCLNWA